MANTRNARLTVWYRLVHLNPAVWRGLIVGAVALLASIGVVVSRDVPDNLVLLIGSVAAIVQAVWTREGVVPEGKVVAYVENPISGTQLKAGPAVPAPTTSSAVVESAIYQKAA